MNLNFELCLLKIHIYKLAKSKKVANAKPKKSVLEQY